MGLFKMLSERGEMLDQMGLNGYALKSASWLYFALAACFAIISVAVGVSEARYLSIFIGMTALVILSILLSEAANSLLNPSEALTLAHQPINGATWTAAKLSHLARIVLYLVPGLNTAPALLGPFLKGTSWWYPLYHLAVALIVGFGAALTCCAAYGWMLRFIPIRRLKAAGQFVAALPFLAISANGPARNILKPLHLGTFFAALFSNGWVRGSLAAALVIGVVFGIRSLSADYLVRASMIVRSGASTGSGSRSPKKGLAALVRACFGGQTAAAGFAFTSRMMLRDWQFRRQLIPIAVVPVISMLSFFSAGRPADPFSGQFSAVDLLPHMLGLLMLLICSLLHFGTDYKGAWVFLSAPSGAMEGFARGIFATLWITFVLIPHIVAIPILVWLWGAPHALLFVAWSLCAASAYLSLELLLIDGVPFSRQTDPSRQTVGFIMIFGSMMGIAIAVAIQHFLIFRYVTAVVLTGVALGAGTFFVTRASLDHLATAMRYDLGQQSTESKPLYKEVAV